MEIIIIMNWMNEEWMESDSDCEWLPTSDFYGLFLTYHQKFLLNML